MKNKVEKFKPKSGKEELEILLGDDRNFTNTEKYLCPYIYKLMSRYGVDKKEEKEVYQKIIITLRIAARHYLAKEEKERDFKFGTYFAWWAIQVIKKELGIKEN